MRIYTKTGDAGETGLIGGGRVAKHSLRITAIGEVDELNAAVGVARVHARESVLDETLGTIQNKLFDLGAELATPAGSRWAEDRIHDSDVESLEKSIDDMTAELPELKNFILPGGTVLAAQLHFARSVCRRAERAVLRAAEEEELRPQLLQYMNRLSDWLFVAARTANARAGVEDVKWSPS
ncbi:MAG: cob(I)yrinic acid a,c-diamide adenosyltransferase [Fimbriimonadaceae bacterium]